MYRHDFFAIFRNMIRFASSITVEKCTFKVMLDFLMDRQEVLSSILTHSRWTLLLLYMYVGRDLSSFLKCRVYFVTFNLF